MGELTEQSHDRRMIDEWALYRKGALDLAERRPWGGGGTWMRYHGAPERPLQCALTLVTEPDHAVSVLALGSHRQMLALHDRCLELRAELSRRTHPPVTILLHGEPWTFHGAGGTGLLGVAQARGSVVLLGHDGERVRFLHGDGGDFTLVVALRPSELPEKLDLDAFVVSAARTRRSKRPSPAQGGGAGRRRSAHRVPPVEVVGAIHQHHRRILQGVEVGEEEGEAARLVVRIALEAIARAAETVERPRTRKGNVKARRAIEWVRPILDVLYRMGEDHRGSGRAIFRRFQEFDRVVISMTADEFVSALGLIVDTGTCLASRPSFQVWLLRGDGIANPHAQLHRELCEETRTAAGRVGEQKPAGPERAGPGPERAGPGPAGPGPGSAGPERAGPGPAGPESAGSQPERAVPEEGADVRPRFDDAVLHLNPEERFVAVVVGRILGDSILEGGAGTASTDGPSPVADSLAVLVRRALLRAGLVSGEEVARFHEHHWPRLAARDHQAEATAEVAAEPEHAEPSPTSRTPLRAEVAGDPADPAPPPTRTGQKDSSAPTNGRRYDPRRGPRRRITPDVTSPGSRISADRCASA